LLNPSQALRRGNREPQIASYPQQLLVSPVASAYGTVYVVLRIEPRCVSTLRASID
jgi:hypothetical protein